MPARPEPVVVADALTVRFGPAEVLRGILPRERRHVELGLEGLERFAGSDRETAAASVAYWMPRVAETFGPAASDRFDRLRAMGLRHTDNETLRQRWRAETAGMLSALKLA